MKTLNQNELSRIDGGYDSVRDGGNNLYITPPSIRDIVGYDYELAHR